jgi:hypothetical protein
MDVSGIEWFIGMWMWNWPGFGVVLFELWSCLTLSYLELHVLDFLLLSRGYDLTSYRGENSSDQRVTITLPPRTSSSEYEKLGKKSVRVRVGLSSCHYAPPRSTLCSRAADHDASRVFDVRHWRSIRVVGWFVLLIVMALFPGRWGCGKICGAALEMESIFELIAVWLI